MKNEEVIEGYEVKQVQQINRFTITEIRKDKISAVGLSRLGAGDRYSDDRAKLISLGRAKKALIKKLSKEPVTRWYEG